MNIRVALLACAGLFAVSSAASAEPPIGSRLGNRLEKKSVNDQRDAAQIAHQLAGCILAKRGSAGRDLLAARNADEVKKLEEKTNGDYECFAVLPGSELAEAVGVNYPPDIMRGDIAEELLKRNRRDLSALQPLPLQKVYARSWFEFSGRPVSVDEMAACVADTNPSAITALIDSQPFSGEEGEAFGKLIPYLGPCLRAGTKLDGKREPLRAALAEALYQRMTNPSESVAPTAQTLAQVPQQ